MGANKIATGSWRKFVATDLEWPRERLDEKQRPTAAVNVTEIARGVLAGNTKLRAKVIMATHRRMRRPQGDARLH